MKLELSIRILDWLARQRKPVYELSLSEIETRNAAPQEGLLARIFLGPKLPLPKVVDRTIVGRHGAIPIRLYYPQSSELKDDLPLIVFFHGGGWVTGSLETHDRLCRRIAKSTGALVMAVDYRLAPWHKYPVPLEDCYDAFLWASSQAASLGADPDKLMIMGDSVGGNLAAAVCLMARDLSGPPILRQILLYPSVDTTLSYPSHQRYVNAPFLSQAEALFYRDQYINTPVDIQASYCSPILAESLEQLPPAFILTAEYDPLHDEAKAFAEKLIAAGGSAIYRDYPGMIHAFLIFPGFCSGAASAFDAIAEDIKGAIGRVPISAQNSVLK